MRIIRQTKDVLKLITLDELKSRGNIVGTTRDNDLAIALYRAVEQVENISNVSLSENKVKLITEDSVTFQRLYFHPILSIDSVINSETGSAVDYTTDSDNSYVKLTASVPLTIEYTTAASTIVQIQVLRQCVLDLAIAYFDGLPINQVLVNIPRSIC